VSIRCRIANPPRSRDESGHLRLAVVEENDDQPPANRQVDAATGGPILACVKPNPPYLATIVIAVVLMVIGLSLEGSLISIAALNQAVGDALGAVGIKASHELARLIIVASPALLIVGSLVPGI
jgi:hypothetical protein